MMHKYYITRKTKKPKDPKFDESGLVWDRLPEEADQAFNAFKAFLNLGFARDMERVALRIYGSSWESNMHHVEAWAELYDWQGRAELYDAFQEEHYDKLRNRAQRDVETRFREAAPDVAEMQIDIALGEKKGDRVQSAMITGIIDRVAPKPTQKPQEVNILNRISLRAPELPGEVKQGLLTDANDIDFKNIDREADDLIPDELRGKRK